MTTSQASPGDAVRTRDDAMRAPDGLATSGLTLAVAAGRDAGRARADRPNQDHVATVADLAVPEARVRSRGRLFVLSDGMGSRTHGGEASRLVVETMLKAYYGEDGSGPGPRDDDTGRSRGDSGPAGGDTGPSGGDRGPSGGKPGPADDDPGAALLAAVRSANGRAHAFSQTDPGLATVGATVVAALVHGSRLWVVNVGDSRAYLLHGGRLERVSADHTLVQRQVDAGILSPAAARDHPGRHVLEQNLGRRPEVEPHLETRALGPGDVVLLCSDGLWGVVAEDRIAAILAADPPEAAVRRLVDLANEAGGPDNISAIVARVEG